MTGEDELALLVQRQHDAEEALVQVRLDWLRVRDSEDRDAAFRAYMRLDDATKRAAWARLQLRQRTRAM